MSYRLSRSDIRSLKILLRIGNVFSAAPSYDFERNIIAHPSCDKIRSALLLLLMVFGTVFTTYQRALQQMLPLPEMVIDCASNLSMMFVYCSIVIASTVEKPWVKLLGGFQMVDGRLGNRNRKETNVFKNVYVQLAAASAMFCAWMISLLEIGVPYERSTFLQIQSASIICSFFCFYVEFLILSVLVAFKSRYRDLTLLLEENLTKSKDTKRATRFVREVANFHRLLNEMVGAFNCVFGWPLALIFGSTIINLLGTLNYILLSVTYEFFSGASLAVFNFFSLTLILIPVVLMAHLCDSIVAREKEMVPLCYRLQECFLEESPQRKELLILAKQATDDSVMVVAADFFTVGKCTLLGILGTATTYFIVLIQLKGNSC